MGVLDSLKSDQERADALAALQKWQRIKRDLATVRANLEQIRAVAVDVQEALPAGFLTKMDAAIAAVPKGS